MTTTMTTFGAQNTAVSVVVVLSLMFCPPLSCQANKPPAPTTAPVPVNDHFVGAPRTPPVPVNDHFVGAPRTPPVPVNDHFVGAPRTPPVPVNVLPVVTEPPPPPYPGEDDSRPSNQQSHSRQKRGVYHNNEGSHSRQKRGVYVTNEEYRWTNGIVPYVISAENSESDKLAIYFAMEFVSNRTCIRFVPWDSDTKQKYGLANDGRLNFIVGSGCWSFVGNKFEDFPDGQRISCCYASVCIHELGHALGVIHEQSHTDNEEWLRTNWFDIDPDWVRNYDRKQNISSRTSFTEYDRSSPMHYPIFSYSKEMTLLFPDVKLITEYHYFSRLISDMYKCQERNCSSFPIDCQNTGFVTLVNGECACSCPEGLDPNSGCRTQRTQIPKQTFPGGRYALAAPEDGCPSAVGFANGTLSLSFSAALSQPPNKLLGEAQTDGSVSFHFCTMDAAYTNAVTWPRGMYCIYKLSACPAGFTESTVTIGRTGSQNSESGSTGDYSTTSNTVTFYYCCRSDGMWDYPIDLPNTKPFVLFRQHTGGCQVVKSMNLYESSTFIKDDSNIFVASQGGPYVERIVNNGKTEAHFYYCYYSPISDSPLVVPNCADSMGACLSLASSGQCDASTAQLCPYSCNKCPIAETESSTCFDANANCEPAACSASTTGCDLTCRKCQDICGGLFTLNSYSDLTITSPNFPSNYGNHQDCYWLIEAPEDYEMVMWFNEFNVEEGSGDSCEDSLEINFVRIGQRGQHYCGVQLKQSFRSTGNIIELRLTTNFQNTRKGFNATFRAVNPFDHCYEMSTMGEYHRGTTSNTRDWKTCLPWDQVQNCKHSAYAPGDYFDGLDGNYCRNPGHGKRPWCYTDAESCTRNYCDVCGLEPTYDVADNCDPASCGNAIVDRENCASTCNMDPPFPDYWTDVSCSAPAVPQDAASISLNSWYNYGAKVTFTCQDDPSFSRTTTCLSDGSWTPVGSACAGCPEGWAYYRGFCYQEQLVDRTFNEAVQICNGFGGTIAEPHDDETNRFLINFRDDGKEQWMGLRIVSGSGYVWTDGTKPKNWFWSSGAGPYDCTKLLPYGQWTTTECIWSHFFVCQIPARVPNLCVDMRTDCSAVIANDPDVCTQHPDFAKLMCRKTCYGETCQDPCSASPCQNGGTCLVENGSYRCVCDASYEGTNCETEITGSDVSCDDLSLYCEVYAFSGGCEDDRKHYVLPNCLKSCRFCDYNAATCVDGNENCGWWADIPDDPQCPANPDYMLSVCKKSCGQCDGEGCIDQQSNCVQMAADGLCSDGSVKAVCPHACGACFNPVCTDNNINCHWWADNGECVNYPAYMEDHCLYSCGWCDRNPCYTQPCQNGGTCSADGSGGYTCACTAGWVYDNCQATVDGPCYSRPCQNGGTCSEEGNTFQCRCPVGFSGSTCTESDPCATLPCANGGTCSDLGGGSYSCNCTKGFGGDKCEEEVCVDLGEHCAYWEANGECTKSAAYMTVNCAVTCGTCAQLSPCWVDPPPCQNGASCFKVDDNTYSCSCAPGYQGDNCETGSDPCNPNPCQNGGTCSAGTCDCTGTGYTGDTCSVNDPCDPNPCQNGGTCNAGTCDCTGTGYTGDTCSVNDPCDPNPCQNGGTCNAGTCDCTDTGFIGDTCSVDDPCDPNPCQNGGTCNGGTCDCTGTGFIGDTCSVDDPCDPNPCQNGGTCNGGTCDCTGTGFIGDTCSEPEQVSDCETGWSKLGDACFKYVDARTKYADAISDCAAQHSSSNIAFIKSSDENDLVKTLASGNVVWLGGDKLDSADFEWNDGTITTSPFSKWKNGEPNGVQGKFTEVKCMYMNKSGTWLDSDCNRKRRYVCRYDL